MRGDSRYSPAASRIRRDSLRLFPAYIDYAEGLYKYDVDGNRIVDYVMGNGSLLMGHSRPEIVSAVQEQAGKGTHAGGASTHEVRYAEAVKRLIPSLERVRFTASGTESTYLALRLARLHGQDQNREVPRTLPRLARLCYAGVGAGSGRRPAGNRRYGDSRAG